MCGENTACTLHERVRHFPNTMHQVATVLDQFHKFLGPELKAVTGESAGIDEILDRVDGLALPLNKVDHDLLKYICATHSAPNQAPGNF